MSEKKIEPRTWLTEGRERLGLDRKLFGMVCGASEVLMTWLEEGLTITHPNIATRIVRTLGLGVDRYNEIVHPEHHAEVLPEWVDPPTEVPTDLRKFLMGK